MSPAHHPSDATLLAYASGALREGPALVVACHLSACQECRDTIGIAEAIGGVLLDELPPAPLAPNRFAEMLLRLEIPATAAASEQPVPGEAWLPQPLRHRRLGRWRWIGPGIGQIVVVRRARDGSSARLLRLAPGRALPRHGHKGVELAGVLFGSYSDENSKFAVGDCSEMDEQVRHRPVADPERGCICLIATSGPLDLYGPLGRIIQAILGL